MSEPAADRRVVAANCAILHVYLEAVLTRARPKPSPAGQSSAHRATRLRLWVKAHRGALVAIAAIGSIVATLIAVPTHTTFNEIAAVLPWVSFGIIGGEIAWIGGAAMMLTAIGGRVTNPFKIRSQFARVAAHAINSTMFRLGFWTNTAGAVVQFVVPAVGICWYLPYQLWGILGIGVLDLAATVALRGVILTAMRRPPPVDESG